MAIITPENLLKNLDQTLKSAIVFNEKITIATVEGNAILINKKNYDKLIFTLKYFKYNDKTN